MRVVYFRAGTSKEARKILSELPMHDYNEGDKAEVTYPDGARHVYVLQSVWIEEGDRGYIIRP